MKDLPNRWLTPSRWPRVGSQYVHICDAASQIYSLLYGDTEHLPTGAFVVHVSQILGDWFRDGQVRTFTFNRKTNEFGSGSRSDWLGSRDVERVSSGYIQKRRYINSRVWDDCDIYIGRPEFTRWLDALKQARAPTSSQGAAAEATVERRRGRPPKHEPILLEYARRLRAGSVVRVAAEEAQALLDTVKVTRPPTKETIAEKYLPRYHSLLEWDVSGRAVNADAIASSIEADLIERRPD